MIPEPPPPLPELPDLPVLLAALLRQIPRGSVSTYGTLAASLGDRAAARWVGTYALHHEHSPACCCHRVVRADGSPGGFIAGSPEEKLALLAEEGVPTFSGRAFPAAGWFDAFNLADREPPLAALRRWQNEIAARVVLEPLAQLPRTVLGLDVSYAPAEFEDRAARGVAAAVLVEVATGRTLRTVLVEQPVRFPYITSYLAFRELPLLLAATEAVRAEGEEPEMLLVDGSGILHPRRGGIAALTGVLAGIPTVGLTKKLICGRVEEAEHAGGLRLIHHEGDLLGAALRPPSGTARDHYVSPGHRIDVPTAAAVVSRLYHGRRLPEPIHQADRLSRRRARELNRGI